MRNIIGASVGVILSLACAAKDFQVGNAGTLSIDVPEGWQSDASPGDSRTTIELRAGDPRRLRMMISPFAMTKADVDVRGAVQRAADRLAPNSVEKELPLMKLDGADVHGYYFKATDPAPKPGEYRFMYQGGLSAGTMTGPFTILFNDGAEKEAAAALSALRSAKFRSSAR